MNENESKVESAAEIVAANEELAKQFRAANTKDHEGTRESLERCAAMIDRYGPDIFPASKNGQIDFARAMMECAADEIRAFLKSNDEIVAALKKSLHDCLNWMARKSSPDHGDYCGKLLADGCAAMALTEREDAP